MSTDIIVGLLTLLGLVYLAWVQRDVRAAETSSHDAEAMLHLTTSLLQAIEALGTREKLIGELREHIASNEARIAVLEASDRVKSDCISSLEKKVETLTAERQALLAEQERWQQTVDTERG